MNEVVCISSLWLGHFGFILIFAPLVVKLLRIQLILGSDLVKRSFSWTQTFGTVFVLVIILVVLLTSSFIISPQVTNKVILTDNQDKYTQEIVCYIGTNIVTDIIFLYETLLIIIGLFLCYKTRHLPQGLSGCGSTTTGKLLLFYFFFYYN